MVHAGTLAAVRERTLSQGGHVLYTTPVTQAGCQCPSGSVVMDSGSGSSSEEEDFLDLLWHAAAECDAEGSAPPPHEPEPEPERECEPEPDLEIPHAWVEATDEGRIAATMAWIDQLARWPGGPHHASFHGAELRSTAKAGVGIFASADLPAGHAAILLARHLTVSHQRAIEWSKSYNDVGSILCQMNVPVTTCIAIFLVCEQAAAVERTLKGEPAGGAADRAPTIMSGWAASLPGFATLLSPIPALHDPDRVQPSRLHSLPSEVSGVTNEAMAGSEDAQADSILRKQADAVEAFIGEELRRGAMAPFFPAKVFSRSALRWALGIIYSRGLRVGGTMLLMPLIEMANHAAHGSLAHNLELLFDDSGAVVARTVRPVANGEELRLCYHEDETAAHMHSKYGIPMDELTEAG